jgi:hypothetical protein
MTQIERPQMAQMRVPKIPTTCFPEILATSR